MLAQKTPVPALTLNLNDSWNSFYFQDLTNFRNQLLEDYQLRFLILNYLHLKRYWLRRFSIKKNNGFYFITVSAVSAQPSVLFHPLVLAKPITLSNKFTEDIQVKIFSLQKKILPLILLTNKFKQINKSLVYKHLQARTKKNYDLDFFTRNYKYLNKARKQLVHKFKFLQKPLNFKKFNANNRFFSTKSNIKLQTFNLKKQNVISPLKSIIIIKYIPKNFIFKIPPRRNSARLHPLRKWIAFVRHITKKFFLKKKKSWVHVIRSWLKKWGHKYRFRRNVLKRFNMFMFHKLAAERLTNSACFFKFTVAYWHFLDYKSIKGLVAFERHRGKKFFNQLIAATHFTFSQGTPSVLTDYLRSILRYERKHIPVLNALQSAVKYWLCSFIQTRVLDTVVCQGVKIEVIGKIDGADRTRTWRINYGAIPTSTFSSNIRYEQTIVCTRYGILHVHVWLHFTDIFSILKKKL